MWLILSNRPSVNVAIELLQTLMWESVRPIGPWRIFVKTVLVVLSIALLAGFASASTVDFNSYLPLDTCSTTISTGGLDFNTGGYCMAVWDSSSPNGNGTPALIYTDFGGGHSVTMSLTGGGAFTLNSVDMTISWYDANPSEVILVNGNPITLIQGLQTYNLNLTGTSVTFSELPSHTGYWLMDNVVYNGGTTPEPGTLALLGSGVLAGLGVLRRKMLL
jgi:hypothetical protein